MPLSLKMLRRNPDRPTLRQRAAALKAAAGKVIRRPKPEETTGTAPVEAWVSLDTTLLSQVRELVTIEAEQTAILEAGSYADAFDAPDWVRLERTREAILARVIATRAHTMEGLKAKARLFDLESVANLQEPHERLALSIVADINKASPALEGATDPHLALLPALRQAFAWTREAHPLGEEPSNSTEGRAHTAVLHHSWDLANRITDLPPPTTLAGLGALALALSVYAEEIIGRPQHDGMDDQRYPEERRLVAAIRAMMSIAGVEPLPGWVGFEVGTDSEARWEAVMEQAGDGSLPAWALAGKSGPDAEEVATGGEAAPAAARLSDLAQACIGLVERRTWIDQGDNARTVGDGDDAWTVELDRQSIVFRRAIEEPSVGAADLAAKARLMLDDLDRFHPEGETTTDDERLMRVILREVVALVGGSSPDTADATSDGAPVIARADEAPSASLPIPDLSDCSVPQPARLYEAFHAAYDHLSALGQLSCFWEGSIGAHRERFNPAGNIVDREADRLAGLFGACAEEIARREPRSERDSDEILTTRLMHELVCNGRVHDPALMRDIARAWAA